MKREVFEVYKFYDGKDRFWNGAINCKKSQNVSTTLFLHEILLLKKISPKGFLNDGVRILLKKYLEDEK